MAAYALSHALQNTRNPDRILLWLGGSIVAHDLVLPSAEFQFVTRMGESGDFQSLGQPGDLGPAAVRPGRQIRGFLWAEVPKKAVVDQIIFAPFGGDPATDLIWDVR